MPHWLPYYKEENQISTCVENQLLNVSAAQIDRLLADSKSKNKRGRCTTRPGSLLKTKIPIRTENWDITRPGYIEADTVAHCGTSLEGNFVWTVTYTDIYSGWTSNQAIWTKEAAGVVKATQRVEHQLPFEILGFDCDNGSEFLNRPLMYYLLNRTKPIGFTRSRPYHKDDNAHVEQKNWSHVRRLLGYDRLCNVELCKIINDIYENIWGPLNNFFLPSAKLVKKERDGAKINKQHDKPKTPCERLLDSSDISEASKEKLRNERKNLNPFELSKRLTEAVKRILNMNEAYKVNEQMNKK